MDGLSIARERIAREADEKTGFLDLGRLGLSELPRELFELQGLLRLNLGAVYLDEDLRWHESASQLGRNTIASQIEQLSRLKALQYLSLSETDLIDLTPLKGLQSLQSLDCRRTQVSDLTPLKDLPSKRSTAQTADWIRSPKTSCSSRA